MKKLKLTELNKLDKLHNDELFRLKGGESGSGIFGWCCCPCSCCCDGCTDPRATVKSTNKSGNCRCTDKTGGSAT